jgi:hypothetical protein
MLKNKIESTHNDPSSFVTSETIRRSTSFKSKNPSQASPLGCTCYGKKAFYNPSQKVKPMVHKQNPVPMHKTAADWYNKNTNNNYQGSNQQLMLRGRRKVNIKKAVGDLPAINLKEGNKFIPNPVSEKSDKYIRYIIEKKKVEAGSRNNSNTRYTKQNSQLISKRNEAVENEGTETHTLDMGGIKFEVHSKSGSSPLNPLEQPKEGVFKEMNLMNYDFNGSSKRMASNSPDLRESYHYKERDKSQGQTMSKTRVAEKLLQSKRSNESKMNPTASTHDAASEKLSANSFRHSIVEDDEFESITPTKNNNESFAMPILFTNNG